MAIIPQSLRTAGATFYRWAEGLQERWSQKFGRSLSVEADVRKKMPSAEKVLDRKELYSYSASPATKLVRPILKGSSEWVHSNLKEFQNGLLGNKDKGIQIIEKALRHYHDVARAPVEVHHQEAYRVKRLCQTYLALGDSAKASGTYAQKRLTVERLMKGMEQALSKSAKVISQSLKEKDNLPALEKQMRFQPDKLASQLHSLGPDHCFDVLKEFSNEHHLQSASFQDTDRLAKKLVALMSPEEQSVIIKRGRDKPSENLEVRAKQALAIIGRRTIGHSEPTNASFQRVASATVRDFQNGVLTMEVLYGRVEKLRKIVAEKLADPRTKAEVDALLASAEQANAPASKKTHAYKQASKLWKTDSPDPVQTVHLSRAAVLAPLFDQAKNSLEATAMLKFYDKVFHQIRDTPIPGTQDVETSSAVIEEAKKITPELMRELVFCNSVEEVERIRSRLDWYDIPESHPGYSLSKAIKDLFTPMPDTPPFQGF